MSDPVAQRQGYRGYVASRSFMGQRAPQHVQNLVIRDYAARRGLDYLLSATEYAMPGCTMMLEQLLQELDRLQGIIAYSLFMMPQRGDRRLRVYRAVLEKNASLHFAVEGLKLETAEDVGRLEDIFTVRQLLPACLDSDGIAPTHSAASFSGR